MGMKHTVPPDGQRLIHLMHAVFEFLAFSALMMDPGVDPKRLKFVMDL